LHPDPTHLSVLLLLNGKLKTFDPVLQPLLGDRVGFYELLEVGRLQGRLDDL
jgi:hypothetical protein